jgi:O-antigen ligase/polysaccharide polymerase Wzy-like membrane protein
MIGNSVRAVGQPVSAVRVARPWLAVVLAGVISGAVVSGKADAAVGQKPALLVLGVLVGCAFFGMFLYLGPNAVLIWPIAATGGYLLQIPRNNVILTFDRVWIGGLLAYIALNPRRIRRTEATRSLTLALLWLVVSFGLRSASTSLNLSGPLMIWVDAIVLPAILFVACERYCLLGADRMRRLAGSLMIAGGVLGAIGIAERIVGFELATLSGGSVRFDAAIDATRISGPYPAPEPYVLSLAICLAATLYWILTRQRGSRLTWSLLFAGLEVTGIALALFRAGWIAAILVALASFGYRPGRIGRMFAVTGLIAALAFAATTQLESNKTVATRVNNTDNIKGRLATYKEGLEIFRSAPIFGIGVDRYTNVAEARPPAEVGGSQAVQWPHSTYVGLLAEQGAVGFVPLLLLSYAVWRVLAALRAVSFRSREATVLLATVTGAALAYLIMSLTLTMLPYEASNTFFAAFLGGACGRLDSLVREAPQRAP